jgi:glycosyltransferase involved in cell wall biosynthesis
MKLSVVIPAYNRAEQLPFTLRSLLAQERVADEILVVDDGSMDNTASVAESFGQPVRVIRQLNQGPGAARNRGLAEAEGEFIHFFDSDDLASPNLHRDQLAALAATGADLAYSPWVKLRMDQPPLRPTNHVLQAKGLPRGGLVRALLTNWSTVPITADSLRPLGGLPNSCVVARISCSFWRCCWLVRVRYTRPTLWCSIATIRWRSSLRPAIRQRSGGS